MSDKDRQKKDNQRKDKKNKAMHERENEHTLGAPANQARAQSNLNPQGKKRTD